MGYGVEGIRGRGGFDGGVEMGGEYGGRVDGRGRGRVWFWGDVGGYGKRVVVREGLGLKRG